MNPRTALLLVATLLPRACVADPPPAEPAPEKVLKLPGGGRAYPKSRRVEFDGMAVYPTRAPIELFACAVGGKEHESVLTLACSPDELHTTLLVFGLRDKREFPDKKGPQMLGDPAKPVGDRVVVSIEWETEKGKVRRRAEDLLTYGPAEEKRSMPRCGWTFAGSEIWKRLDPDTNEPTGEEIYVANRERTLMSTWHDPTSVLDNPLMAGEDDRVFRPNFDLLPPRGTRVTIIIEVPDEKALAELMETETAADREYDTKLRKEWQDLENFEPTAKEPEPVPEKK
jgi:hypothetical protein